MSDYAQSGENPGKERAVLKKKLILAITGASGAQLGYHFLRALHEQPEVETHLILSNGARQTIAAETALQPQDFYDLADYCYPENEMSACISSGSYFTDGMIVAPCSMKTLSAIAAGYDENLIIRAADVCLKEGRKVVLLPREMPFGRAHLKNMLTASEYGCAIVPPMLTFYNESQTLEQQMDHIVGKTLMLFQIPYSKFHPWVGGRNGALAPNHPENSRIK